MTSDVFSDTVNVLSALNLGRCVKLRSVRLLTTTVDFAIHAMIFFECILSRLPPAQQLEHLTFSIQPHPDPDEDDEEDEVWGWDRFTDSGAELKGFCPPEGIRVELQSPLTWDKHRVRLGNLHDALGFKVEIVDRVDFAGEEREW